MISLLVYIVILVIVAIFLWWLLQQVPLPEPLMKIATIVLVAIGVIALVAILLQFSGSSFRIGKARISGGIATSLSAPAAQHMSGLLNASG